MLHEVDEYSGCTNGFPLTREQRMHDTMQFLRESELKSDDSNLRMEPFLQSKTTASNYSLRHQSQEDDQLLAMKMQFLKKDNEIVFLKESLALMVPKENFVAAHAMILRYTEISEQLQKRLSE